MFEDKEINYFIHEPFKESLKRSALLFGYKGRLSSVRYFIRRLYNWFLSQIAQFSPLPFVRIFCHKKRNVNIGQNVFIGSKVILDEFFPQYITLENNVGVNCGTFILTHTNFGLHLKDIFIPTVKNVVIKEFSVIGINSTIMPGVSVGPYSVVSAGSVVFEDVPPYTVVRGNPAKVVAKLPNRIINKNINKMGLKRWVQES